MIGTIDHKGIVADGLDLQIIIKIHDIGDLIIRFAFKKRLIQFPRLTGRTHQDPFPVFH